MKPQMLDAYTDYPIEKLGEITFARTLLECIEVDYEYPWNDGGK